MRTRWCVCGGLLAVAFLLLPEPHFVLAQFRPGTNTPTGLPPSVPQKGPAWYPGRIAFIDAQGLLDGITGTLTNCVLVDGSSAPCSAGSPSSGPSFSDAETPSGTVNGSNTVFTLANAPSPAASLVLVLNTAVQTAGSDYSLSGASITFINGVVPQTGATLRAWYRH